MDVYMEKRDYETLETSASEIRLLEEMLADIKEAHSALYPDNGRAVTQEAFENAVTLFESQQRRMITALDALIP